MLKKIEEVKVPSEPVKPTHIYMPILHFRIAIVEFMGMGFVIGFVFCKIIG